MLMAAQFPQRLDGALLNDVGPVIEKASGLRIRKYIGKRVRFANWDEAAITLKSNNPGFESLTKAEWLDFARRVFIARDGHITNDYDLSLAETFPTEGQIEKKGYPAMWKVFDALRSRPVTVLRAEHSDLLSAQTVSEM